MKSRAPARRLASHVAAVGHAGGAALALYAVSHALWPAAATALTLFAVLAWATATVGWALRYGSWFGRPRLDGRPG